MKSKGLTGDNRLDIKTDKKIVRNNDNVINVGNTNGHHFDLGLQIGRITQQIEEINTQIKYINAKLTKLSKAYKSKLSGV